MGIYSRDYIRDDPPGRGWENRTSGWSAVTWIIVINAAAYLLQMLGGVRFEAWFMLDPEAVLHGQVWRLTTYDFLHDRFGIWHILFNMYILYITGRDLEARRGSREFVAFYLVAGVISGAIFCLWSIFLGHVSPAIGASGAVSAVMIVYALTHPHEVWRIWGILPIPVWVIAALTVILDLHPMLLQLSGEAFDDGVAHSAHIGGIVFGALYQRNNWRISGWQPRASGGRSRFRNPFKRSPRLKVHQPTSQADSRFDVRVDELLDKVAKQGEASLTPEERSVLIEASRRARDRMPK
jgi:membrane associated rhomboid family serine protease